MYVNGGYAGTTIKAKIAPDNDKPLQLSCSISGEDEGLELVRQQISFAVAERMHAAVMRGERVAWGNSATFTRDGLQHRPPKVLGKAELRRSAYKSDLTYKMNAGVFDLVTSTILSLEYLGAAQLGASQSQDDLSAHSRIKSRNP